VVARDDLLVDPTAGVGDELAAHGGDLPQVAADRVEQRPNGAVADVPAGPAHLGDHEVMPIPRSRDLHGRDDPRAGLLHRVRELAVLHRTAVHDDEDDVVERPADVVEQGVPQVLGEVLRRADDDDPGPAEHRGGAEVDDVGLGELAAGPVDDLDLGIVRPRGGQDIGDPPGDEKVLVALDEDEGRRRRRGWHGHQHVTARSGTAGRPASGRREAPIHAPWPSGQRP
jgi:hypothetical protein